MLCLLQHRSGTADRTAGINKLSRVKKSLASIALITACVTAAAVRTGAVYITVCKETGTVRAEKLLALLFLDIAVFIDFIEYVLNDLSMTLCAGASEIIE